MTFEVLTRGFRELEAAFEDVKVRVDPVLGKALTSAAEPIKADVKQRANGYGAPTVSGVRIRRRGTMVRVEQGARKTTGRHPDFGGYQQRNFFDPALVAHSEAAVAQMRSAVDDLIARTRLP